MIMLCCRGKKSFAHFMNGLRTAKFFPYLVVAGQLAGVE